ncbi:hypothetical protein [Streptomyces sp. NPDC048172]|uniref:hypothetical protein n=1 Tax=Streptomyces sp. NPDC048172 TaxID=3365505 RepID=UPI00371338BE
MTGTYSPVHELNLLKQFDDECPEVYAQWAGLDDFGELPFLRNDPELSRGLLGFASANGSGSLYALWKKDEHTDLADLPVVLLGDEGGIHLVARDVRDFLRLLGALEADLACDWDTVYERDEDELPAQAEYHSWLEETFGLTPPEDPWDIIEDAEEELGQEWAEWSHARLPDAVFSPVHALNLLRAFQERNKWLPYAGGCALVPMGEWAKYDEGTDLLTFARANAEGDTFALWLRHEGRALPKQPVVLVGDGDERLVVAKDTHGFLALLGALGALEAHVTDDGIGLRPCEPSPRHEKYVTWLDESFGLAPAPDAAVALQAAR